MVSLPSSIMLISSLCSIIKNNEKKKETHNSTALAGDFEDALPLSLFDPGALSFSPLGTGLLSFSHLGTGLLSFSHLGAGILPLSPLAALELMNVKSNKWNSSQQPK